jgi:2',3'-cyclic-nucleotide 2'-phosphodiesterase (5'-nucleotidase family)
MKPFLRPVLLAAITLGAGVGWADDPPDTGPNLGAQAAADVLRSYAGADGAFIHAGFLKSTFNRDDLATFLSFPTDGVALMNLTGEQIRGALEYSVSLYPQSNLSFLQLSGFDVTFKKNGPSDHRIVTVTVNGSPLENSHTYSVAMPSLLARGAVGYFKFWGKDKPTKEFGGTTMEDVLKGKKATEGSPRWSAQG